MRKGSRVTKLHVQAGPGVNWEPSQSVCTELREWKFFLSRLWRLDVQDQPSGRFGVPCPQMGFSPCVPVSYGITVTLMASFHFTTSVNLTYVSKSGHVLRF